MDKFGEGLWGKAMRLNAEIVNGVCPTCTRQTVLISICAHNFRCTNCGTDMEQKVNGVISYIPITGSFSKNKMFLKQNIENNGQ
tara:strand:+ start:86 stop:337 length:252 start_codon:yes stop_codon:yes gene_type:complete